MFHHRTRPDTVLPTHYAASTDAFGQVLVQLGDAYGEQLRIPVTPEQARHFAGLLLSCADQAERESVCDEGYPA